MKFEKYYKRFANLIVNYSTKVKKGDVVIIENFDIPEKMTEMLISEVHKAGAHPVVWLKKWSTLRALLYKNNKKEIDLISDFELSLMKKADVYISLRASLNSNELKGVPDNDIKTFQDKWLGKVHYGYRVNNTRWCSVKWPTLSAAKEAKMSLESFEKYYFNACINFNYEDMSKKMDSLVRLLDKTDIIKIVGPGTNIVFSKKGIFSKKSAGDINIPDGEVYTAPVKNSISGYITYNIKSDYHGRYFQNIKFIFENGKIIKAFCKKGSNKLLNKILDTDDGSRFIGEFAFGLNPSITKPINERMFDEKMAGSIHLTPGNSYKTAGNGNKSSIHWDLILNQTSRYGGGEIYFDGKLIRKNGIFVLPELNGLNLIKKNK